MAHIFFERLEKRQSTQTLLPSWGGDTLIQPVYGIQVPGDTGWGNIGYPSNPIGGNVLLYGISPPYSPYTPPTGGLFPWTGGLFGMFGGYSSYTPYSQWTTPFNNYNNWNSWGSGGFFSPIWDFMGGLFGGGFPWTWRNTNPVVPDFRVLYGIFPDPVQPNPIDIIAYYGIGVPTGFGL